MAYDQLLARRISSAFRSLGILTGEKKMFGGICYLVDDKMCVGIVKDELMIRVSEAQGLRLLKQPHVRQMDFTGKPMKGFLYVGQAAFRSEKDLCDWIGMCHSYILTVPAKKKKKK